MFKEFFFKELGFAFKRPMIYIFFSIITLMVFGAVVSDNFIIGGAIGNVYKNAPSVVTMFTTILTVIGLLFATTYFNNAALRDHSYSFNEIMFSAPISKSGYYFGKFCGALIASSFVFCGIYFGVILGTFIGPAVGWVDADRMGPIPWKTFINTYFIYVLPNMFLAGSLIYFMATQFKNTIISFVGTLAIIIGYIVSLNMLGDIDSEATGAMIDMFGVAANGLETKYYTPQENNTIAPAFKGYVRWNRILWTAIGSVILILSYFLFSFKSKNKKGKVKKEKAVAPPVISSDIISQAVFAKNTGQQFLSFFKINFLSILKSTLFKIMLLFGAIMLISNIFNGFEYFGLKSYPVTYKLMDEIYGLSNLFVFIVVVFFSGELIWRDRDSHLNEVVDGTPHQSIISMFAKALSLVVLAALLHLSFILIAIIYQALNGYTQFELGVYLTDFFYRGFIPYAVYAGILIFIQVVINNKYLGYFISILIILLTDILMEILEIKTGLLSIGHMPDLMYSDMNGFGPGVLSANWWGLYWVLFSFFLVMLAGILWPRGKNNKLKDRYVLGFKSINKGYLALLSLCGIAWLSTAGFVYYNTQVLNDYPTENEFEQLLVNYEKKYKQYENIDMPKLTDIVYHIDIFPYQRDVKVRATMTLVNKTDGPIESLHFSTDLDWNTKINIPNSSLETNDQETGYQIYSLNNALSVSDTLIVDITTEYITKGFENGRGEVSVINNGSFFNNTACLPTMGYSPSFEIQDKNERKKLGLPTKKRMPELEEECSLSCMKNYLSRGSSDWVNLETYISTADDQIAIAPGSLVNMVEKEGRRTYHYKVDHPSLNFYSFISAKYEVAKRDWKGISLEVYYHPSHNYNIEMMLDAIQGSLEYYTTHFGPYYHKQARIIEFPRYATFAQAFPGTMPYSEAFGFIIDLEGDKKNNVIDAVIAHEMAHQYWAHQVIGADMQGSTMLSESFAEYSSLMVMKQTTDRAQMKDFLRYDMNRYLRGRSSEADKELPLDRVENQGHIHYGKGSIIMYALQEYIGEDSVNLALKEFLEEYRYQDPPYPNSSDFMRYLEPKVPDSLQYLIDDWFKEITLYDLRMKDASYVKEGEKYLATINIECYKVKADSIGNETRVPIKDWIDVGFFKDKDENILLYKERILVNQNEMKLTFKLDTIPAKAAVDPDRILIDRVKKDNIKVVSSE